MAMDLQTIQRKLKGAGFDPGPIDGIRGRLTIRAIKQFQMSRSLEVDGVVGPITEAALRQVASSQAPTASGIVWLDEARRLKGTMEREGAGNNPIIMDWADDLDIHYPGDDVPWCGLFVAHCIAYSLPEEPLPDGPLGARNWRKFGKTSTPALGAVMVFWRESKSSGKGHVAFYVGEDYSTYHVLGGNQSNHVNEVKIAKNRFLEARWPTTAGIESGSSLSGSLDGGVSQNEQ